MNHDIASDLLWAVSSLTDLIARQNVVCTTYVNARRHYQKEMWKNQQGGVIQETGSVDKLAHTLANLTVEMHSIASDHKEASSAIERCAEQLCQSPQELTLPNIEVIMALLQSLIESSEVVFLRVELLNEFRDAAEVLLCHGAIKPQTVAFVTAFDEVIGAYNHQWFAANDMVDALKRYFSECPLLQDLTEDEDYETIKEETPLLKSPGSPRIEIEWATAEQVCPTQGHAPEEIVARICELEEIFTLAQKRAKELHQQIARTRTQCTHLKATTRRMYHEATQTFARAAQLHSEAHQTLQWLRSL